MSDNKLVKTLIDADLTFDLSSSFMNYMKFTAVMAGSIALKKYLEDQKILSDSV